MMKKIVLSTLLLAAASQSVADEPRFSSSRGDDKIVGSWVVTISSPFGEFAPLKGMYSFTSDGVLIATDVGQVSSPASTAGQGTWQGNPGRSIAIKWINFAGDGLGNVDGKGVLTGTLRVSDDGNRFTGPAHFVAFDNLGNVVFEAEEVLDGKKVRP